MQVGERGLQAFIARKYPRLMRDVRVRIAADRVTISGNLSLFTGASPFSASGTLLPRADRYVDLVDPTVEIDGKPLDPTAAQNLLKTINPVLDSERDLHLGGFFRLSRVEIGPGVLSIKGTASIPLAPADPIRPH